MTLRIETWTLDRIAREVGGALFGAASSPTGVSTDTRTIRPGSLFVALSGENFDGHDYVGAAGAAGASAAIVSSRLEIDLPQVVTDDTLRALQALGRALCAEAIDQGMAVTALTGSNGKTTTKELLAAIWGTRGSVHATAGNLNNHIGVPLTLCALPSRVDRAIIEMGSNGFGDISQLIELAPADDRLVTSIGAAHLEGFGSIDGVRRAKSEIFERSFRECLAVVPFAERERLQLSGFEGRVVTVGEEEAADVRYSRVAITGGSRVELVHGAWTGAFALPLPGPHNAHNLAIALASMLGRDVEPDVAAINAALAEMRLPGGRWRRVERGQFSFLDDAYNANPASVRASFATFVETSRAPGVRRYALIGEMFELGDDAERLHEETARWVGQLGGVDGFGFVGAYAEAMALAATSVAEVPCHAFEGVEQAASWLNEQKPGHVFLKASRGQKLESVIELTDA